jgi:serine/threonine-protein kinase RsbW
VERELVLEIPNDVRTIESAVEYVMRRCETCCEEARRLDLNLRVGLSEALSNAMLYGNDSDPLKRVRVEVTMADRCITARVTDEGSGFDPESVPDPTTPSNIFKSGGRGIFLMRSLMDEVMYNDRGNSVTLILRFQGGDRGFGRGAQGGAQA